MKDEDDDDDMYPKSKRTRKQRIPYSPPNDIPMKSRLRERRSRRITADSLESEESQETSEEVVTRPRRRRLRRDDTSDESAKPDRRRVYHLRQNKPTVERFQATSSKLKITLHWANFISGEM